MGAPILFLKDICRENMSIFFLIIYVYNQRNNTRLQMRDEFGNVHAGEARPVRIALAPRHWSPSFVALHAHNHYAVVV